jgi:hypothetical protein
MPDIKVYHNDNIRIGGEWPMCLDVFAPHLGCVLFYGYMPSGDKNGCGVQLRLRDRELAVIFLQYRDTELPGGWQDSELLYEHRPKSWPKEVADGAE